MLYFHWICQQFQQHQKTDISNNQYKILQFPTTLAKYIIQFFWMNQEKYANKAHEAQSQQQNQSNNSDQFQQLQTPQNGSVNTKLEDMLQGVNQLQKMDQDNTYIIRSREKQVQNQLKRLNNRVKQQQGEIQGLRKANCDLNFLYRQSLTQVQSLKLKIQGSEIQKCKLSRINEQLYFQVENVKEQSQEYMQKINCLQKKIQLQRQDFDNKFSVIRKTLQKFTKNSTKCLDNQTTLKLLQQKLTEVQTLLQRIHQIEDMIIDKTQKTKPAPQNSDTIEQKVKSMQKVQNVLLKQQNKINSLREQVAKLEEHLRDGRDAERGDKFGAGGIGKWFDPVIKFCKIQENKEKQVRKKKDGV